MRRRGWPLMAVLAVAAGFVTFGSVPPAPAAEGGRVSMVDNEPDLTTWHFDPAEITVAPGSTVVWTNQGNQEHTVTADDNSFDSGYKKNGTTFQRAFAQPGRYPYHCAPHPWMKGTVVVVAGAATPPTTSAPAAASSTTSPPLSAPAPPAGETSTSAPAETTPTTGPGSGGGTSAAPASSRRRSGNNLAGTLAIVLIPTLGGLAIGARLRRSRS